MKGVIILLNLIYLFFIHENFTFFFNIHSTISSFIASSFDKEIYSFSPDIYQKHSFICLFILQTKEEETSET